MIFVILLCTQDLYTRAFPLILVMWDCSFFIFVCRQRGGRWSVQFAFVDLQLSEGVHGGI